jgi:hypothetical protein
LAEPPPPQVKPGVVQSGQGSCLPHPSPTLPQYDPPGCVHASGVHASPETMQMLFVSQVMPAGHVPQSILPWQPSPMTPQYVAASLWQLTGVHSLANTASEGDRGVESSVE